MELKHWIVGAGLCLASGLSLSANLQIQVRAGDSPVNDAQVAIWEASSASPKLIHSTTSNSNGITQFSIDNGDGFYYLTAEKGP